jgi:hypothetical protein
MLSDRPAVRTSMKKMFLAVSATALTVLACCPSLANAEHWVAAWPASEDDGPILYVDLFHSKTSQDVVIDYLPERHAFDITHSAPLGAHQGCRRVDRDRVRCKAFGAKATFVLFYGADRPTHVVVDDVLRGYQSFEMGGADDFVDASRGASRTEDFLGNGDDTFLGSGKADYVDANRGGDVVKGRTGDDILRSGSGHNVLLGGRGDDSLYARNGSADRRLSCGAGRGDDVSFEPGLDPRPKGCEKRSG